MKKKIFAIILGMLTLQAYQSATFAQLGDVGGIISIMAQGQAKKDVSSILSAYLKPFGEGFGHDLNGNWYNTAKTHKLLGFDLSISASGAMVPSSDKSFDLHALNLGGGTVTTNITKSTMTPTVAGDKSSGPNVIYSVDNKAYANFTMPSGTGLSTVPAPMVQLGLGLIKKTDLIIRWVPKVNAGDKIGSIGLWGLGFKHNVGQWIPGVKKIPFLNISAMAGFSSLKANADISLSPDDYPSSISRGTITPSLYKGQEAQMQINGFTTNIITSIDIPVISVYMGLGLERSKTTVKFKGKYPFPGYEGTPKGLLLDDKYALSDPLDVTISNIGLKPRLNAGLKLKMGVIHLHVDYTLAKYNYISTGLSLNIR